MADFEKLYKETYGDPREVEAPPGSRNELYLSLPQQRKHVHDVKGMVLYLPATGLVVVPTKQHSHSWTCVVVDGGKKTLRPNDGQVYPRNGHDIDVSDLEMQTAVELPVVLPPEYDDWEGVQSRDRDLLMGILWRSRMPGMAPLTPEHDDWKPTILDAEAIIEGRYSITSDEKE